jgi:hypothetical protein
LKIQGRCRVCGRDFPIDLVLSPDVAGHCPFCGTPLDPHYGGVLVTTLAALERAGTIMERTLNEAKMLGPNLDIDASSILDPLRSALEAREAASAERKAVADAS